MKSRTVFSRLWAYTKPYRIQLFIALFALLAGTLAELGIPLLIQDTVDRHLVPRYLAVDHGDGSRSFTEVGKDTRANPNAVAAAETWVKLDDGSFMTWTEFDALDPPRRQALRRGDIDALASAALILLGLLTLSIIMTFVQIMSTAQLGQGVMGDIRHGLLKKTMAQSAGFLQTMPVGKLVTRVTSDVETVNEFFTSVLTSLVKDLAIMAGVISMLFLLDPYLATWVTMAVIPVAILLAVFRGWYQTAFRRIRNMVARMNTYLAEHLSGMSIIQIFVRQGQTIGKFKEENEALKKASLGEMYVFAVFRPLVDLLGSATVALVLWLAAGRFIEGLASLGVLIAFINLIQRFFEPVLDISDKFNLLQSAMAGGERVFELLDEEQHLADTGTRPCIDIRGDLVFKDVFFAYRGGENILKGLDFTAHAGEKIALVGYTGAGKTTIANILTRLWDIQAGCITLDGIPITEYPLSALRQAIQPLQQDAYLFSDTVRENILMGKPMGDDEIFRLLASIGADDLVKNLPQGLDTLIIEGGGNISAGQRQILNFARILAQNPRVLIMDEATANIDTETEQRIQKAMKTLTSSRTSLVIAHRLSTIQDADRIIVLGGGRVQESGTHQELLAHNGFYANLYRLQFQHGG